MTCACVTFVCAYGLTDSYSKYTKIAGLITWKSGLINYCCKLLWQCASLGEHCSNGVTTAEGRKLHLILKAGSTVGEMVGSGCVLAGLFLKTSKQTQINKLQPLMDKQSP